MYPYIDNNKVIKQLFNTNNNHKNSDQNVETQNLKMKQKISILINSKKNVQNKM